MSDRILDWINRAPVDGYTPDDWNAAVRLYFGPFIRRKSVLHEYREVLRTELVNLAKILPFSAYTELLGVIARQHRRMLYQDRAGSLEFLRDQFEDVGRSSQRWMSLFLTRPPLAPTASLYDRAQRIFDDIDGILEGAYKPQLRVACGFCTRERKGFFPTDIGQRDLGLLDANMVEVMGSRAALLIRDPEHGISMNQWRNIAAHKSFEVRTSRSIEIGWGRKVLRTKRITFASLRRVLHWTARCYTTVHLANLITYLEFMNELGRLGLAQPTLRLESSLTGLCHNLHVVGFECRSWEGRKRRFVLSLRNRLPRPISTAVIHASQALDSLSMALESDPLQHDRFDHVAVELLDTDDTVIGSAEVRVTDAIAATKREISQREFVARIRFDFADWDRVGAEIQKVRDTDTGTSA